VTTVTNPVFAWGDSGRGPWTPCYDSRPQDQESDTGPH